MADNFRQKGDVIKVTAGATLSSGAGHQVSDLFGVALADVVSGAEVELMRVGVFNLPKLTTDVMSQGDKVYWDIADDEITLLPDTGTNKLVGFAIEDAGSGVLLVDVLLTGEASV